jgi:hypothetical protein
MTSICRLVGLSAAAAVTAASAAALCGGSPAGTAPVEARRPAPAAEAVTVGEARRTARQLQATYIATLRTIHRHYYESDEKQIIPARALEDVFKEADEGTGRTSRWIAVSTPAMNVDHEPQDEFETRAVEELRSGKEEVEEIENGVYRRAGAIPLAGGCLRCHVSGLTKHVGKQRVAGFVVTVPVRPDGP